MLKFYRCFYCGRVAELGKNLYHPTFRCKCGSKKFTETNLTLWEEIKFLASYPKYIKFVLRRTEDA